MSVTDLPKLYTEAEVAQYLDVCPNTVARERRAKRLGYIRIRSEFRYKAEHIRAYLEDQECTAISTGEKEAPTGTSTSTTNGLDNASALALALKIAQPQTRS